jgi:hypothetical protein
MRSTAPDFSERNRAIASRVYNECMRKLIALACVTVCSMSLVSAVAQDQPAAVPPAHTWATSPTWYDGQVEKATYSATRTIYGKPRAFEAIFFTNKEQHDQKTNTKAVGSDDQVEVWKHNQIEVVPTPNYDYKFEATTHLRVKDLLLTRLDVSSQEFCGTSFKQYAVKLDRQGKPMWSYFGFSYMPESGRVEGTVEGRREPVVAFNSLPIWLRSFDFAGKGEVSFALLPDQKSHRATPWEPVPASVKFTGETEQAYQLQLTVNGGVYGTYEFAKDRLHVMLSYTGNDGLSYQLKSVERTNYWTIKGE